VKQNSNRTEKLGAPVKNIILRFKAAKVGKMSLKLIYHRPFEKNKRPIKTFEVKVIVK